jgi:hypothetical protein
MISLPDCSGFVPFCATSEARKNGFDRFNPHRGAGGNCGAECFMTAKRALKILFCCIFVALAGYNLWAATRQPLLQWGGLTTGPDRYWTIAAFMDAYCGFLTFYVWVYYKETRWHRRILWFAAIMLLGNIAASAYVLLQLVRSAPDQNASGILIARNH